MKVLKWNILRTIKQIVPVFFQLESFHFLNMRTSLKWIPLKRPLPYNIHWNFNENQIEANLTEGSQRVINFSADLEHAHEVIFVKNSLIKS